MDARERIQRLIAHQTADRVGIFGSFWWETERDFQAQGMPEDVTAEEYLDLDAGMSITAITPSLLAPCWIRISSPWTWSGATGVKLNLWTY